MGVYVYLDLCIFNEDVDDGYYVACKPITFSSFVFIH